MPASTKSGRSGNRDNGNKKSESKQMLESLRGACPPHKKRDFDMLVKQLGGDEEKIQQKIQEWWEEPQLPQEEEIWEDVNKKLPAKGGKGPKAPGRDNRDRGGRPNPNPGGGGSAPGRGGRGDRDRHREGRGRGGRGDRGGRSNNNSGPPPHKQQQHREPQQQPHGVKEEKKEDNEPQGPSRGTVPTPVTNAPALKGAWGRALGGGSNATTTTATTSPSPAQPAGPASPERQAPPSPQPPISAAAVAAPLPPKQDPLVVESAVEVGVVSKHDPTPSGMESNSVKPVAPKPSGNVWATRGSAHLIQAEKPRPPAPVVVPSLTPPKQPAQPVVLVVADPEPVAPTPEPEPEVMDAAPIHAVTESVASALDTGMPVTVSAVSRGPPANAWGKKQAPAPASTPKKSAPVAIPASPEAVVKSPIGASIAPPTPVEEPVPSPPKAPAAKPSRPAPTNVLNMGHWEDGGDDSQNLDFGFGSFGTENDVADVVAPVETVPAAAPATTAASTNPTTAVSPARPPPGLSIGGMPPMPTNAVLVHELENTLENASLNPKPESVPVPQEKPITTALPTQPTAQVPSVPASTPNAPALPTQPNYNQYGMPGMYNYNAAPAGSGFVGVHAAAGPFLGAAGVIPQQQQPPKVGAAATVQQPQSGVPTQNLPQHPQAGLYGAHHPGSVPSAGNDAGTNTATASATTATAAAGGMPPGMPNMPAYANPALYYGQQPFHLGQHQGGVGYGYGYGAQFGGAVQGGFGYQQVMGQTGGYGAPHYGDDGQHQGGPPHQGHSNSHSGGSGGYQKNTGGGYRGRNSHAHHNNNQYQGQQYNPQQHGGYGGQPYGMGYHNDHFNQQRGGYGHGNMGDPYGMQQQQQQQQQQGIHSVGGGGGFHQDDNDHNKGRRGGNNRNNNTNSLQFQQGPPHGQLTGGQQQPFGLQGQDNDATQTSGASGGASGWSNNNNQGGGWSGGGTSSWQQGN